LANLLICHAGRAIGPYTAEETRGHLAGGLVAPDTPAWTEGLIDWSTVSEVLSTLAGRPVPAAEPEFTKVVGRVLLPDGVAGFCWGALLAAPVWCLGNRVWIGLLTFIPGLGQLVQLWLGFNGRELAWGKGPWRSVDDFARVQRRWTQGALIAWGLLVAGLLVLGLQGGQFLSPPRAAGPGPAVRAAPDGQAPAAPTRQAGLDLPASRQAFERYLRDRTPPEVRAVLGAPAYEREDKGKGVRIYVYRQVTLQPGSQAKDDVALVAFVGGRATAFQFLQEKKP
jgi:hypothetical protein